MRLTLDRITLREKHAALQARLTGADVRIEAVVRSLGLDKASRLGGVTDLMADSADHDVDRARHDGGIDAAQI